ncbi:acetyltransferase [Pseudoalteromonas fenneropenaei]|uniref:Acetyltransferase n=1 Tax=Pseudoalteromonas fenneropenaei TaxID=1737459 RepID=A0ABV7CKM8_9GAMM
MSSNEVQTCAILGASGHGKVIAEMAELCGYEEIYFFDDRWPALQGIEHWSVFGDTASLFESCLKFTNVVIAIGNNTIRIEKQRLLQSAGANFSPLCHPKSHISSYAKIGAGSVVMANAVINPFAYVGNGCIINTSAVIEHDCSIEDGAHVSPGAMLAGGVCVGETSWVGIGAQVKQLVKIGSRCVVGAGATVVNDISDGLTVVGTPAKPIVQG